MRRIPVEKRWGEDCAEWVRWAPWCHYKDAVDADGDAPEGAPAEERASGSGDQRVFIQTREKAPRVFSYHRRMRRSTETREVAGDAQAGSRD